MTIRWIVVVFASLFASLLLGCGAVKNEACGDGKVGGNEQCDEGLLNGDAASCCSDTCTLVPAAVICRAALGECDLEEACSGTSGACPADETMPDNMPCGGNGVSACSAADTCRAGVCDNNDMPASTPCSGEATCNPDRCDASGICVDAASLVDGSTCTDGGGNTCCGAACVVSGTAGICNACSAPGTGPLTIAIVESESISSAQNMDMIWKMRAEELGHTATIHPQTVLDDINNLQGVDVLIVASHEILVSQQRRNVIASFATMGKGVYIQGEFDPTMFEGNKVWETVVDLLGANFTWGAQVQGQLTANAVGCIQNTPQIVAPMSVNFAATGSATGVGFGVMMTGAPAGGAPQSIGFRFCRPGGGLVITTTDKDNIRAQTAGVPEFMKNILFRLGNPDLCPQ